MYAFLAVCVLYTLSAPVKSGWWIQTNSTSWGADDRPREAPPPCDARLPTSQSKAPKQYCKAASWLVIILLYLTGATNVHAMD